MFYSQMTSCHSCDAHIQKHTRTCTVEGVKSVLGTASLCGYLRCQAPGSTHSGCYCPFLFLPSFPLSTDNSSSLPVGSPFHTTVSQCSIVCCMLISVVKSKWFQTNVDNSLWCCSNNNPPPPLSRVSAIRHFPAVSCGSLWLIVVKLVFMDHPTLPCLFALCCVLTINLVPGAATFNGLDTSCFVNASVHMLDTHAWGYDGYLYLSSNLRSKSGISIIAFVLLMFIVFVVYREASFF